MILNVCMFFFIFGIDVGIGGGVVKYVVSVLKIIFSVLLLDCFYLYRFILWCSLFIGNICESEINICIIIF